MRASPALGRRVVLLAGLAVVLDGAAPLHSWKDGTFEVRNAWARPGPAGGNDAGYFTLTNTGKETDSLISASSATARRISIHRSAMIGATMTMRPSGPIAVPSGASLAFIPGGLHLMLEGLNHSLALGDHFEVLLRFAKAAPKTVAFSVRERPPGAQGS